MTRPSRRMSPVIAAALATATAGLAACGSTTSVGAPATAPASPTSTTITSTTSGPSSTSVPASVATTAPAAAGACPASSLHLAATLLSEGTGAYLQAWSLTDTGPACSLAPGRPSIRVLDAAGATAVTYQLSDLAGGSNVAIALQPGQAAWFETSEAPTTCTGQTIGGGPFRDVVDLPGGQQVSWSPPALSRPSLLETCPTTPLAVGGLRASRPTV